MTAAACRSPPPPRPVVPPGADRPRADTMEGTPLSQHRTLAVAALAVAPLLPLASSGVAEAAPAAAHTAARPALTVTERARLHRLHLAHLHRLHLRTLHNLHVWHLRTLANLRAAGSQRARVVKAARSYIGTPYVNGGMSRAGVDCSALVDLSYRAVGKRLPRTTQALARTGRNVTGHARIGDVLLYGTTHAAIVAAVSRGRVTLTVVARHSGTLVTTQRPYAAYTVRSVLA